MKNEEKSSMNFRGKELYLWNDLMGIVDRLKDHGFGCKETETVLREQVKEYEPFVTMVYNINVERYAEIVEYIVHKYLSQASGK